MTVNPTMALATILEATNLWMSAQRKLKEVQALATSDEQVVKARQELMALISQDMSSELRDAQNWLAEKEMSEFASRGETPEEEVRSTNPQLFNNGE